MDDLAALNPNSQNPNIRKKWVALLASEAVKISNQQKRDIDYQSQGSNLRNFLDTNGLPKIEYGMYISMEEAIRNSVKDYINTAQDVKTGSGSVLWNFLQFEMPNLPQTDASRFRIEAHIRRNMIDILTGFNLDLMPKDKINALDYLNYKYATDDYRRLYAQLGNYDIKPDDENFEYVKNSTVKVLGNLLKESQKSNGKAKIISAQDFLRTISRNGEVLKDMTATDKDGEQFTLNHEARKKLLSQIKRAGIAFSEEELSFFASKDFDNINTYIKAVMNKSDTAKKVSEKIKYISEPYEAINAQLWQQKKVDKNQVKLYAQYLSTYAMWNYQNENVSPDLLQQLVYREAETTNQRTKAESLFPEYLVSEELPVIDKKLVLDVAKIYSESFTDTADEVQEFNPYFAKKIARMFGNFTVKGSYTKPEVQELCDVLRKDGDPITLRMSQQVMQIFTSSLADGHGGRGGDGR